MTFQDAFRVFATVVVSIGGGGALVAAFAAWVGKYWAAKWLEEDRSKYQAELEKLRTEMERSSRRLQADLDKTVFVHRLQFEAEFRALSDVWSKVSRLRLAMGSVRPMFDRLPVEEGAAEKEVLRRIYLFGEAYNVALTAVDDQRPFLAEPIYWELKNVIGVASYMTFHLQQDPMRDPNWWQEHHDQTVKIGESLNQIAILIRERLATLQLFRSGDEG